MLLVQGTYLTMQAAVVAQLYKWASSLGVWPGTPGVWWTLRRAARVRTALGHARIPAHPRVHLRTYAQACRAGRTRAKKGEGPGVTRT